MEDSQQKESEAIFKELELEAFKLKAEGKLLFALDKLDKVMKVREEWYHFFYKAIWLWELNKIPEAVQVVEYSLNFEKPKGFFFRYLSAEMLFHSAVSVGADINKIDESVNKLDQAMRELEKADFLLLNFNPQIYGFLYDVPEKLKEYCPTILNNEDLGSRVLTLRTRTEMIRQSLILFKTIMQAETRVNTAIDLNRKRIDSERIRTIELLGIFTAIFAFIFSGVQIAIKLPVSEAILLQGGIALMMVIFFLGLHLVIEPEARTKTLNSILSILIIILLILPLYAGLVRRISNNNIQEDIQTIKSVTPSENLIRINKETISSNQ